MTAAPSVRGRAARIHGFIASDGTWMRREGQSFAVKGLTAEGAEGTEEEDERDSRRMLCRFALRV
jgi:hypothetical protein